MVYIQHGSLADLQGLIVLGQIAKAVDGLLLAGIAVSLIVCLLKLLDVRDELGFAHRLDERRRLRWRGFVFRLDSVLLGDAELGADNRRQAGEVRRG